MRRPRPVPAELLVVAQRQEGLVSVDQCEAVGLGTDRRAALMASGGWTRVTRGVYAVAPDQPPDPDGARLRSVWTALLAYGPDAIAIGLGALALHGVQGLPASFPPEAAMPGGRERHHRDGIRLRQFDDGMTTIGVAGRRVASIEWAFAQAVPEMARANAVAAMDSALHQGLIDRQGLVRAHRLARGRRGVARTHGWWDLADGRAESALETFGRLDCFDAGVPPDELQVVILDAQGLFVARGDLGWLLDGGRWLIAEMDGRRFHDTPDAFSRDRRRQNALLQVADVLRFTADDVRIPGLIGSTVRRHLRAARRVRPAPAMPNSRPEAPPLAPPTGRACG